MWFLPNEGIWNKNWSVEDTFEIELKNNILEVGRLKRSLVEVANRSRSYLNAYMGVTFLFCILYYF